MLTKCQSLTRFPWLGLGGNRHHDYTHNNAGSAAQQRTMRDICRWHVEEFAYLLERMKSIPEGAGNLLDNTCAVFVHEHAEANSHKCNGLAILLAGGAGKMKTGMHTKSHNSIGDVYLTLAEEVFKTPLGKAFPTAEEKMSAIVLALAVTRRMAPRLVRDGGASPSAYTRCSRFQPSSQARQTWLPRSSWPVSHRQRTPRTPRSSP